MPLQTQLALDRSQAKTVESSQVNSPVNQGSATINQNICLSQEQNKMAPPVQDYCMPVQAASVRNQRHLSTEKTHPSRHQVINQKGIAADSVNNSYTEPSHEIN